jgi:hypothetical protein
VCGALARELSLRDPRPIPNAVSRWVPFLLASADSPEARWALSSLVSECRRPEERVACLAASIQRDTVTVLRISPLEPEDADSLGISAIASVERCGPPEWSGTVHTHIALYTEERPSARFSAQDRIAMRLWYDRWHADAVFCLTLPRHAFLEPPTSPF